MEEILFFLLQIVIEIAIEGVAYLLTSKSIAKRQSQTGAGVGATVAYAVIGGILGGVSALIYSHVLLPQAWMRIANLLITPVLFGGLAMCLPGPTASTNTRRFWNAYFLAVFFAASRLMFAAS
ncbi:MAG: hypothetical protein JWP89_4196 [Schlesneria sp.]|nr:hypothetical protein [Schlesneria sp.]